MRSTGLGGGDETGKYFLGEVNPELCFEEECGYPGSVPNRGNNISKSSVVRKSTGFGNCKQFTFLTKPKSMGERGREKCRKMAGQAVARSCWVCSRLTSFVSTESMAETHGDMLRFAFRSLQP